MKINKEQKKYFKGILILGASLLLISLIIGLFSRNILFSLRIVFGSIYVLFLPGFLISYIFFPKTKEFDSEIKEKGAIDWLERITLSFALSIAIVPLCVFYLNLIGIRINLLNSFLTILGIIIASLIILYLKYKKS